MSDNLTLSMLTGAGVTLLFFMVRFVWKPMIADFLNLLANGDVHIGLIIFIAVTLATYLLIGRMNNE